jgi:putative oxidoreductase
VIRLSRVTMWACATLLGVAFVLVGILKLAGPSAIRWNERFVHWGYPAGTRHVVGVLEVLAGVGVLIPKSRRVAAAILIALMIGAVLTHIVNAEYPRAIPPLVLGGLAVLIFAQSRSLK